jgi:DNA primase
LLNYSDEVLENQNLSDFLFNELEDVVFVNPIFSEIYEGLKEGWEKGELRNSHYFIKEGKENIKKIVTDLIAQRYDISVHWGDKYHIHIPREGDLLNEMAYTNVLRLKLRVIQKMLEENKSKIKVAEEQGNEGEVDRFLETQIGLDNAKKELSEMLGIVIAR